MTYTTKEFHKDVAKLREIIAKCDDLERQNQRQYCYKPYRTIHNY